MATDEIKKWDANELIKYLEEQDLKLDDNHFNVLRKERITGQAFLSLTEEHIIRLGFEMGPAITVANFIKELKIVPPVTDFSVVACDSKDKPENTATLIWSPQDLNANHGGKYVYVGMHYEYGQPPVTSLDFLIQDESGPHTKAGWKSRDVDLNKGAGGKFIYITWKTGEFNKRPIIKVKFIVTASKSPPVIEGWIAVDKDLCTGLGGSYIFAYYQRDNLLD